jgi:hypothetical protein
VALELVDQAADLDTVLAALLSGHYQPAPGERVGIVVSGGTTIAVDFAR